MAVSRNLSAHLHLPPAAAPWWAIVAALSAGLLLAWLPLPQAAALLLGGGLLLAVLLWPLVGIFLLLFAAPWGALEAQALGLAGFDSGQFLFLITAASWLAQGVLRRRFVLPSSPFTRPLLLFGLVAALSLLDAPSTTAGFVELFKWVETAVMVWIVTALTRAYGYRPLLAALLLAGASQALLGLWQFALQPEGPDHFAILGGRFYRAYGTFQQPNPFGAFMAWAALLGAGALLGEFIASRGDNPARPRPLALLWAGFLAATTALALGGLLASWSRGAWVGFAAGLVVLVAYLPRRRVAGLLLLLGALVAAGVAWQLDLLPSAVTQRLTGFAGGTPGGLSAVLEVDVRGVEITDDNFAVIERLAHWQAGLSMADQEPWLGVGFGNYEAAYADFALANWPEPLGHAHNYYINLLAEVGLLGLAAYALLWLAIFTVTLRALRQPCPVRGVLLGLLAVWVALSVHHLLDKLYVNNLYLHLGAMLGILNGLPAGRLRSGRERDEEDPDDGTVC